jgi:alpha-amylase
LTILLAYDIIYQRGYDMNKLYLALILHHHQPEGNFDHIMEKAYQDCYRLLVDFLKERPFMKVALHYSGPLLRWLMKFHPDFIDDLRYLIQRHQVEIISGAYGEAILSIWDEDNQIDQVKMMNDLINDIFNIQPKGFWLAERVWEPTLPSILKRAGIEYTILDDNHFQAAGISLDEMVGYFLTEHKGDVIKLVPSSNKLRYLIPFALVDRLIEYLQQSSRDNKYKLIAMGDDGEKFGVWPGTKKWVYNEKWLEKFANEVEKNSSWLELILPSSYLMNYPPVGLVYLPTMSYFELMEWSLPATASVEYQKMFNYLRGQDFDKISLPFLRGGFWRNFLSKYSESNYMHKRLINLYRIFKENEFKFSKDEKGIILEKIYKAQCNDGFWHGIFSGLYAPHLRKAIWDNLIEAEEKIEDVLFLRDKSYYVNSQDINCDGYIETLYSSKEMIVVLAEKGGQLMEISYKPAKLCLTSCLTRRFEAYHLAMREAINKRADESVKTIHHIQRVKEEGLEDYLIYDDYERNNFVLHLVNKDCELADFKRGRYADNKELLVDAYSKVNERMGEEYLLEYRKPIEEGQIIITKRYMIGRSSIKNVVEIENRGNKAKEYRCVIELCLNLFLQHDDKCYIDFGFGGRRYMDWEGEEKANGVKLISEVSEVELKINSIESGLDELKWWVFPVYTISQSEEGYEKVYQGSSISLVEDIKLMPSGVMKLGLEMICSRLR